MCPALVLDVLNRQCQERRAPSSRGSPQTSVKTSEFDPAVERGGRGAVPSWGLRSLGLPKPLSTQPYRKIEKNPSFNGLMREDVGFYSFAPVWRSRMRRTGRERARWRTVSRHKCDAPDVIEDSRTS